MDQHTTYKLKDLADKEKLKSIYVVLAKTKSFFNRDLRELPKIQATVKRYLKENPELGDYPIDVVPKFPNAYWNFGTKKFAIGLFNADILAHEIEHALSTADSKLYNAMLGSSRAISGLTSTFSVPIAIGESIKHKSGDEEEINKKVNKFYDIMATSHGLASLPTLYEEGHANLGALAQSPDMMRTLKTLGPAYATYLAKALIPIGVYQLAKQNLLNKIKE